MFRVIMGMEEVARFEDLAEACWTLLDKIKKMVEGEGGIGEFFLFETCMVIAIVDGQEFMMNFDAVKRFLNMVGVLSEEGKLGEKPKFQVPLEISQRFAKACHLGSMLAFIEENKKVIARLMIKNLPV